MNDVSDIPLSRAAKIKAEAQAEVAKEQGEAAKKALVGLYKRKAAAEEVVRGIEREIETTLVKIEDGAL